MTNNGDSIHQQPYEVIETEETITRYFNTTGSKNPSVFIDNHQKHDSSCRCPEKNSCKEDGAKIVQKNCQFQTLYKKFNKIRTAMSELKEKLNEINLAKNNLPPLSDADTCEFTNLYSTTDCRCRDTKLQENEEKLEESKNVEDVNNARIRDCIDCNSLASTGSPTNQNQKKSPTIKHNLSDELNCLPMSGDRGFLAPENYTKQLLRKSKKLLVRLIDQELQRVQSGQKSTLNAKEQYGNSKYLKMECIDRLMEELAVLKDLERINGS